MGLQLVRILRGTEQKIRGSGGVRNAVLHLRWQPHRLSLRTLLTCTGKSKQLEEALWKAL